MNTNQRRIAVLGVGNMAKAIIAGILRAQLPIKQMIVYDKNEQQYRDLPQHSCIEYASSAKQAASEADVVLLAVKPQNYPELLDELATLPEHESRLYISIAAGISSEQVSVRLSGACVIRVLPNVPMLIGQGVSVICENEKASTEDMELVRRVFCAAGSTVMIDEAEMNRIIGVTSSSPAYVFRFINAIYQGAKAQGLENPELLTAICDMVIGSATLLKTSKESPEALIAKVASKGGTTEQALLKLNEKEFDDAILQAMIACTARADELGNASK